MVYCDCEGCPGRFKTPGQYNEATYDGYKGYTIDNSVAALIVWFFIIFVAATLVLYAFEPSMLLKRGSRQLDNGKVVLTAFVFSLFVVLAIFLFRMYMSS